MKFHKSYWIDIFLPELRKERRKKRSPNWWNAVQVQQKNKESTLKHRYLSIGKIRYKKQGAWNGIQTRRPTRCAPWNHIPVPYSFLEMNQPISQLSLSCSTSNYMQCCLQSFIIPDRNYEASSSPSGLPRYPYFISRDRERFRGRGFQNRTDCSRWSVCIYPILVLNFLDD